ncbi:MAG TPA: NAD(P)H-binding protein, partial [Parachlamydiaceae bacterium]|nr:NAD(P)H-binding protein [Parachlamydiaceae bacterium]
MKIFVTGSTGFVGKRLILSLLEDGHDVYALCRIKGTQVFSGKKPNLHYIWGDLRNPDTLSAIPREIEIAYYLVHSMTDIMSDLVKMELEVAEQFVKGIAPTNVKQIIYLGGIINDEKLLSPHLKSRLLVEQILKDSKIPVTILRASIIVGTGSASFEIIRDLCEKLPFMIAPKWVNTQCQPIAIRDAIFYLSKALINMECFDKTFDIGGP